MNDFDTQREVASLREALMRAREEITEQKEKLDKLSQPPFAFATVVAIFGVFQDFYTTLTGKKIEIDKKTPTFGDFSQGDILSLRDEYKNNPSVREEISKANRLVIVGFVTFAQNGIHVVVQIDDGFVIVCDYSTADKIFTVAKVAQAEPSAVIAVENKLLEVLLPEKVKVEPGYTVKVNVETMQIVDVSLASFGGDIAYLRKVIDGTFSEVDCDSSIKVVFNGNVTKLDRGDRVVLDATGTVITRNLGKEQERFRFATETNVSWDDIGGLQDAKRQIIEAVELPHKYPKFFRFYNKRPVKGVLLYGPPGCGKTMFGKATATSLATIYKGKKSSSGFMSVKGPEILEKFVGVAEATIRQIFNAAKLHHQRFGYPAVIFIDEADSILSKRGSGISSDMEKTIVPMFLTEMDGLEESSALVILATNRPDILDPAVIRDGRVDRKIKIDRPDMQSAAEIFLLNLKSVPLNNGYKTEDLAKLGATELFSPKRVLYHVQTKSRGTLDFTLANIVNGGMIAGTVDQATSIALHRDIACGKTQGLKRDDIIAAVNQIQLQNADLDHSDELRDFVHDFSDDVRDIHKLRQAT